LAVSALVCVAGCSLPGAPRGAAIPVAGEAVASAPLGTYIKHVVIVIQENRTFDNFFTGYPGAVTSITGLRQGGPPVTLQPRGFARLEIVHSWAYAVHDWDHGKMDGFDGNALATGLPAGLAPYAYVRRELVAPYWDMARQYVLADHMFATMFGQSFTAHLDLVASTANLNPHESLVDDPTATPWGCDAPAGTTTSVVNEQRVVSTDGPYPCFTQFNTIADALDAQHVSWKYYQPRAVKLWSAFDSVEKIREGPDWDANVVEPQTRVLDDARRGTLPAVSWVIPDWLDSDHPSAGSDTGPSWVAAVVNAIGQGPDWKSTAIFVVWDDWGAWYDNVPPPQLNFVGLGIRVPAIIISPYAKKGYVAHTQYEFGSLLKFTEQAFDLPVIGPPSYGYTDTRATSPLDSFDFTQKPRTFRPIPAKYPAAEFYARPPSGHLTDDS
jgi:phospholipase C